jgi:cell division protein FtsB
MASFYRKIKKQLNGKKLIAGLWANKKLTATLAVAFIVFLYAFFNTKGIVQRIRLEKAKTELIEKIRQAEEEQKKLQTFSRDLDSDKKAIEKVAREKYGMMRPGEKVYKVVPKK